MGSLAEQRIEVVAGSPDAALSERIVEFWTANGALSEADARARLPEVLCVLLDREGGIAGVNSVYADVAPLVGRRFWIYRRFLGPDAEPDAEIEMIAAAHEELARRYTGAPDEPLGMCVLVRDRAVMERWPEAVWPQGGFLFAGYTEEDVQVRIAYFEGARI